MTHFSIKLKELLATKSVDKAKVASQLGIDRTLLYRYMNNQALPDKDFIDKLCYELTLTPSESEGLKDAYEMTLIGEETCNNRSIIKEMLDRLYYLPADSIVNQPPSEFRPMAQNAPATQILNSRDQIYETVKTAIFPEEVSEICMIAQPDQEFVYGSLFTILLQKCRQQKCSIKHVCRFQSKVRGVSGSYNLELFSHLAPVLFLSNYYTESDFLSYYYYYNQAIIDELSMCLFPNIIITEYHVLLLSDHYERGLLINDRETADLYYKAYKNIEKKSISLLTEVPHDHPGDWMNELLLKKLYRSYIFKGHPSVSLGVDEDYYTPSPDASPEEIRIRQLRRERYINRLKRIENGTHLEQKDFFTMRGLMNLLETGRFSGTLALNNTPMDDVAIIRYLECYVAAMKSHPTFSTHIVMPETPGANVTDFGIYLVDGSRLIIENPNKITTTLNVLNITDRGIVEAFSEYLTYGIECDRRVWSKDKTVEYLENLIGELKCRKQ